MKKVFLWLMVVTVVVSMVAAFSLAGCKTTTTETTGVVTTAAETTAAETTVAATTKEPTSESAEDTFVNKYLAGKGIKTDGKPLKVGMEYADLISEYVINLSEYAKLLLEKAGAEVIITTSKLDVKLQDSNIDDFIQQKCDIVVIHAVDSKGSAPAIKRLNDAGIPVICVIRTVDGVKMDLYISTSDNVKTGEKAAQFLVDAAKGADVKVASVQGYMGASDAYLREEGYTNVFKANQNIKYVSVNPCDWDPQKAEAAIVDAFTAHPDLWGILSHSDCMAPGVYSALQQVGKTAIVGEPGHIVWSSIDGAPYALGKIKEGYIDSTVEQSPLSVATLTVKGILDFVAQGKQLGEKSIDIPTLYVNKENVDDPGRWGSYDVKSKEIWVRTQEVWDSDTVLK